MLKIKDNVDLKELEKFGFKYRENPNFPILSNQKYRLDYVGTISIYENTRAIILKHTGEETLYILYDLIQARISGEGGIRHDRRRERSNRTRKHYYKRRS